jgi:hypothetical protein
MTAVDYTLTAVSVTAEAGLLPRLTAGLLEPVCHCQPGWTTSKSFQLTLPFMQSVARLVPT